MEYPIKKAFTINGIDYKQGDTIKPEQLGPFAVDMAEQGCIEAPKGVVLPPKTSTDEEDA